MLRKLHRSIRKHFGTKNYDINPEDIFLDATNLPGFEASRFEGRIEQPMGETAFKLLKIVLLLLVVGLALKLSVLGIYRGEAFTQISENNRLEHTLIFANRGVILDRNGVELATNMLKKEGDDFASRHYAPIDGIAHVVGYLKYPLADKAGHYYEEFYKGRDGVELAYDDLLKGRNGIILRETDALGNITSESVVDKPVDGAPLTLSIDASLTAELYKAIKSLATERGFVGGAGVMLDVNTGEVVALTSYPEYNSNVLVEGSDKEAIRTWLTSDSKTFLNRAIGGLYTPGSVVKPILALAALNEKIISPEKKILSTGSIRVENPYDKSKPSIFKDWKAHGWTDMREALAVSSDTYFYAISGGYEDQIGLGINRIDKYFEEFGLKEATGIELLGEVRGVVPTPEWKKEKFDGDIWRLGDTYITGIGQYGTQVTPINVARFIAAIANGGRLLTPSLLVGGKGEVERTLEFSQSDLAIVREGMRGGVTHGTSVGLNVPYVKAAAKTGTAEIGSGKKYVHSWTVGFFPVENPRYAWALVMEKGPSTNTFGATAVMRQVFDWMSLNTPEYFN